MTEEENLTKDLFDTILFASEIIKRHAEQRHILLKNLVHAAKHNSKSLSELEKDHVKLAEMINAFEEQASGSESSDFFKITKLNYLNSMIEEIDRKEAQKESLVNTVMQLDANLLSRDELISILEEYVSLEEASIHKMIMEYSEAQDYLIDAEEKSELYNKLSLKDPRFNAMKIISSYPTGISNTQLSYMLGTSPYQAQKIIKELIDMGMISRHPESDLLEMVTEEVQLTEEMVARSQRA